MNELSEIGIGWLLKKMRMVSAFRTYLDGFVAVFAMNENIVVTLNDFRHNFIQAKRI